jgi:arylsulfatase
LRQGNWKITVLEQPFDESKFELFNLASDPGETKNLASEYPDKYKELIELWRVERKKLGIILPEDL